MSNRTLVCTTCGATARRRSVLCTIFEPALCPKGHGPMVEQSTVDRPPPVDRAADVGRKKAKR